MNTMSAGERMLLPTVQLGLARWAVIPLMLLVSGSLARAEDPVAKRFGHAFFEPPFKYSYDMKFTALDHPATAADVKAQHAVFTLDELGERRVWKMPRVPMDGTWNNGKPRTDRPFCDACQAEELLVDGQWKRYFGLMAKEGAAVIPAEEFDFWPFEDRTLAIDWWWFTGGFSIGMDTPGVKVQEGKRTIVPASLAEPVVIHAWIQNAHGTRKVMPGDLYRAGGERRHSFRRGLRIVLTWAPFDPRKTLEGYPRDCDFAEVKPLFEQHAAEETKNPGISLESLESSQIWSLDLRELFAMSQDGYYRFWFVFDEEALGLSETRDSPWIIQGFEVGKRPESLTAEEQNRELGVFGGRSGEESLRKTISDELNSPAPDPSGSQPLPAEFPEFVRTGFMGGNMSGSESEFVQFSISNSELIGRTRDYSASSVRKEFEKRMQGETKIRALRLMYAVIAARAGSAEGALALLDSLKATDYSTVKNTHSALARLLWDFKESPPDWAVRLAMVAVDDERFVTGMEDSGYSRDTVMRVSYLADEHGEVVEALGDAKCRQAVPLLIERVRKSGASRGYVMALGSLGDERAIPVLMEYLLRLLKKEDDGNDRRDRVVWALAQLKAAEAVPLFLNHLEFPRVVEALEQIADLRALEPLKELVAAKGVIIRDGKPVLELYKDQRLARARIAVAILEPGDSVPRLCTLAEDDRLDRYERSKVILKLQGLGDARAVPALMRVAHSDSEGYLLFCCMQAMGQIRCKESVDGLVECLGMDFSGKSAEGLAWEPAMFVNVAHEGLEALTGGKLPAEQAAWKSWWGTQRQNFDFAAKKKPGKSR